MGPDSLKYNLTILASQNEISSNPTERNYNLAIQRKSFVNFTKVLTMVLFVCFVFVCVGSVFDKNMVFFFSFIFSIPIESQFSPISARAKW